MTAATYLEFHPPARAQYRRPRRARPSGAIGLHTAENATDTDGPDTGAEAVARFITTRTDGPGSYHTVVDSDSIVRVMPYEWEAFHEGTGGNRWSLGLAFACRAADWGHMDPGRRTAMIRNGAQAAADMARWLTNQNHPIPRVRISPAQYRAGAAGFIPHADLDPGRRSDPGPLFPWPEFLDTYANNLTATEFLDTYANNLTATNPQPPKETTMPVSTAQEAAQRAINAWLEPVHHIHADGQWGQKSTDALNHLLDQVIKPLIENQRTRLTSAEATLDAMRARVADLEAHAANVQAGATTDAQTIMLATIGAKTVEWVNTVTAELARLNHQP